VDEADDVTCEAEAESESVASTTPSPPLIASIDLSLGAGLPSSKEPELPTSKEPEVKGEALATAFAGNL
jgi:hypothetical protein